ncbi:hypothetical protein IOD13_19060 [Brevibacterium casei]|nr:hypothetical protein [Brevibacterium casei]
MSRIQSGAVTISTSPVPVSDLVVSALAEVGADNVRTVTAGERGGVGGRGERRGCGRACWWRGRIGRERGPVEFAHCVGPGVPQTVMAPRSPSTSIPTRGSTSTSGSSSGCSSTSSRTHSSTATGRH